MDSPKPDGLWFDVERLGEFFGCDELYDPENGAVDGKVVWVCFHRHKFGGAKVVDTSRVVS